MCVWVCVGVYMLVGCHVNKLYMAARLSGCVCVFVRLCVFVLCESCSAKNGGVLHLNFYVRTKVCYDVFCFDFIFVALSLCLPAAHSLYLLLIMPLAALHFISCI